MDYGAERSRVNQQHWERVHRLQQQQQQKVQRFHRDHSQHDSRSASKQRLEEESKTREEEVEDDAGEQQLDFLSPPHAAEDDEKAASMRQHKAEASAAESEREREKLRERERREMSDAELASMESEYREMKAELDAFHSACLSDANRRFRSMIISLTHRVDNFLSTLVSPSQLLQDLDTTLHVRSAATGRVITAQFAVRCVETFSDLRRRFVHWMREEQGDAVLAFTPDSQFLLPHGEVNAACRTNIQHCYTRQQPQHNAASSSSSKQAPLRPPAPAAHADSLHYTAYQSLSRPLAAFRARATRARAGYALKISGVEEEATAAGGSDAQHRGSGTSSTLLSPPSPQSTAANSNSRSGQSLAASSSFSVSAADSNSPSASGLPNSATWSSPSSSSFSSSPVLGPARPPSSSSPSPQWPILILDEDIALVNFIADGVTSLTVDLLGAVVLVSDQAANASRASTRQRRGSQQPVTPLAHSKHTAAPAAAASAPSSSSSSPSSAGPPPVPYHFYPSRALGSIAASASRLPSRILPNVRQHLAAAPPLPKLPPAITAFFHRHAHPHGSTSSSSHAPDTPVAAAAGTSDAASDAAATPTSWDAVLVEAASADATAASMGQAGDRVPVSPPAELTVSSASEDSGSSEDSVQHVSLTHSLSLSANPIDDADELDEELMANHLHLMQLQQLHSSTGSLQQPAPQQQQPQQQQQQHLRPPLRARHHSHPLAFPTVSASASPSISSVSRYAHHRLSVEVEADAADRIDSVAPSQSFSGVSIPFIDYDMEAEDSRLAERSVTETESSSVRMHDELDDDEDGGINSTGGSTGGVRGGRLRSQYGSSADASAETEMNGTRLQHSHSFSHSSSQFTPPSALPTPSVSRPQSATLDLLSAGVLHLPRSQPPALPSSLPSSSDSPFPLATSPPASLPALNPLMMSPSPSESSTFLQPLSTDSRSSH